MIAELGLNTHIVATGGLAASSPAGQNTSARSTNCSPLPACASSTSATSTAPRNAPTSPPRMNRCGRVPGCCFYLLLVWQTDPRDRRNHNRADCAAGLSAKPAVWERTAPASRPSGRPCPMSAVVPRLNYSSDRRAAPASAPHCREQRSRAAYQRQHHRRVLRRIQAPSLRAQRRRNQQHECNSKHYQRRVLHRYPLSKQNLNRNRQTLHPHSRDCPARLRGQRLKALPVVAQTLSLKSTAPANSKMQAPRADPESRRPPRPMG